MNGGCTYTPSNIIMTEQLMIILMWCVSIIKIVTVHIIYIIEVLHTVVHMLFGSGALISCIIILMAV